MQFKFLLVALIFAVIVNAQQSKWIKAKKKCSSGRAKKTFSIPHFIHLLPKKLVTRK
jgi:hypothetical protein